ncbi:MAG: hypothetical protein VX777_02460 [Chlamydiota bacterium]|nr:hypothetical protein [Chlamydiota bacterium]
MNLNDVNNYSWNETLNFLLSESIDENHSENVVESFIDDCMVKRCRYMKVSVFLKNYKIFQKIDEATLIQKIRGEPYYAQEFRVVDDTKAKEKFLRVFGQSIVQRVNEVYQSSEKNVYLEKLNEQKERINCFKTMKVIEVEWTLEGFEEPGILIRHRISGLDSCCLDCNLL